MCSALITCTHLKQRRQIQLRAPWDSEMVGPWDLGGWVTKITPERDTAVAHRSLGGGGECGECISHSQVCDCISGTLTFNLRSSFHANRTSKLRQSRDSEPKSCTQVVPGWWLT